jgi:hypothetical protein
MMIMTKERKKENASTYSCYFVWMNIVRRGLIGEGTNITALIRESYGNSN